MFINNNVKVGSWITISHPAIAEIMAKSGFDWLAIDLEHSVITIREAEELIRIISLCNVTPLVRLTSNDPNQIKRIMDAGAHGIIVPMVNTQEDAIKAVNAVKYPPFGNRSFGLARAQGYGAKFNEYLEWQKHETVIVVQIEHIDAVDNLEKIFSVEGIDGFIIGPYDLSGSLGIPGQFEHPEFLATIERIKRVANNMNMNGGIHIVEPDPQKLEDCIKEGYKFIAYSVDIRMLDTACKIGLDVIINNGDKK